MIVVTDDNTDWTEIAYPIVTTPDDPNDHQTGISEGDIVGNNTGDPAVLTNFDDNGTPGVLDDGYIGFRVRLGGDKPPSGFTSFFGVGMDANTDGVVDLFLGVDNSAGGGTDQIGIFTGTSWARSRSSTALRVRRFPNPARRCCWVWASFRWPPRAAQADRARFASFAQRLAAEFVEFHNSIEKS